jgi:hypothetical protein
MRNAYKIVIIKLKGDILRGIPRPALEDNVTRSPVKN